MKQWMTLALAFIAWGLGAQSPAERFEAAGRAYSDGNYAQALEAYRALAGEHRHFETLFNLGNTYFKMDSIPQAILYYERAALIDPYDEDLIVNLALANARIQDDIEELDTSGIGTFFESLLSARALEVYAFVSLVVLLLACGCLALRIMRPGTNNRQWSALAGLLFGLFAVVFALAWTAKSRQQAAPAAVVFAPRVEVRTEPAGDQTAFILHEGTKVRVRGEESGWLNVEIASGDIGWLPEGTIEGI